MPTEQPNRGNEPHARRNPDETPAAVGVTGSRGAGDGRAQPERTAPPAPPKGGHPLIRWLVIGGILMVVLPVALWFGIPWIIEAFTTESTDDAYVNSYPTFTAPRVSGQVENVLVVDNNRVHKGDLIVQLDKTPYQIVVNLKRAYFVQAQADLEATKDQVRGQVALARSNRFKLEHTIEEVNNQVALLRANVAALETAKARLERAKADYDRAKELSKTPGAISQQDLDLKLQDFRVAEAQVKQALEAVYQVRVGLGLPANPGFFDALTQVPPDLDQTFSTVRQAVAELLQSAAPLGIFPSSYDLKPKELLEEFYKRDPQGNVDRIYAQVLRDAPAIKQAEAKLQEAKEDLAQAELNLSYCDVYAEIDGLVTRRNVNTGNNVQAGQSLMALRPLKEIWIDANFKETQLRRAAHRSAGAHRSGHVWQPSHLSGPHHRLHDGDRPNALSAAAAKCHGQFREDCAAAARPHRTERLRSGQGSTPLRWFVGRTVPSTSSVRSSAMTRGKGRCSSRICPPRRPSRGTSNERRRSSRSTGADRRSIPGSSRPRW